MQTLRPNPMAQGAAQAPRRHWSDFIRCTFQNLSDIDVRPRSAAGPYYPAKRGTPRETSLAS